MSDWTVHLEFEEGTSSKFWRARIDGKTLYVNYGKIGTNGAIQMKDLASPDAAKKEYDKLVAEKRKKGYVDAGAAEAADDDDDDDEDDEDEDEDEDGDDEGEEDEEDEDEDEAPKKKKKAGSAPAASPAAAPAATAPAAAARPAGGHRMVLVSGNRKVETHLYLDGKTVRMDATETYASPEAAKKAFDRLKQTLAGEGYQD